MNNWIIALVLPVHFISHGQTDRLNDAQVIDLFRNISRSDATFLSEPEKRKQVFIQNFDTLVSLSRKQGFPHLSSLSLTQSNEIRIHTAVGGTFLHILQTNPGRMLNPDTIALFKNEILENRLDKRLLQFALRGFKYDRDHHAGIDWTTEIEENFQLALREWDIQLE